MLLENKITRVSRIALVWASAQHVARGPLGGGGWSEAGREPGTRNPTPSASAHTASSGLAPSSVANDVPPSSTSVLPTHVSSTVNPENETAPSRERAQGVLG